MTAQEAARLFKALAHPPRIALLRILAEHPGMLMVVELQDRLREAGFERTQPTISYCLKLLSEAHLVRCRNVGNEHYYSLCPGPFVAMAEALAAFTAKAEVSI